MQIKNFTNAVNKEDCEYLINTVESLNMWTSINEEDFWNNRTIDYSTIKQYNKKAADIMLNSNIFCKEKIKESYGIAEIYPDLLQVVRWFDGMEQPVHWDDMSDTHFKGLEYRDFGSVLYLNSNYSGGRTYYLNTGEEIIPEDGKLAIHPATKEFAHGVTKIKGSVRYTIASFWTKDKNRSMFK